jgi:hypothetical protein
MKQLKRITKAELIPLPQVPDGTFNFTFVATISGDQYTVVFKFYQDRWSAWFTFPDGSTRQAGIFPGDFSWTGYDDFGLYIFTPQAVIGQNDLGNISVYMVRWAA